MANPAKCSLWLVLAIALIFPKLCSADAYEYQYFIWGPTSEEMIDNPVPSPTPGVYDGHTGTFNYVDSTTVYGDFKWIDMGSMSGSKPPGPWIEWGTVTYGLSWRIAFTYFSYLENGTYVLIDLPDTAISEKTYAAPHARYLADPPVPEPASIVLFVIGTAFLGVCCRNRSDRKTAGSPS